MYHAVEHDNDKQKGNAFLVNATLMVMARAKHMPAVIVQAPMLCACSLFPVSVDGGSDFVCKKFLGCLLVDC